MNLSNDGYQEERNRNENRRFSTKKTQEKSLQQKPNLVKGSSKRSVIEMNDNRRKISQSQSSKRSSVIFNDLNSFLDSSDTSSSGKSNQPSVKSIQSKSFQSRLKGRYSQYIPKLDVNVQEMRDKYNAEAELNRQQNKRMSRADKILKQHLGNKGEVSDDDSNHHYPYRSKSIIHKDANMLLDIPIQSPQVEFSEDLLQTPSENQSFIKPMPKRNLSYRELQKQFDLQNSNHQHKFKKQSILNNGDAKMCYSPSSADQSDASSQTSYSSAYSQEHDLEARHAQSIQRHAEQDPYSIHVNVLKGLRKHRYIYDNYTDNYPLLTLRKLSLLMISMIKNGIKLFMRSLYYQVFLTLVLMMNTVVYLIAQLQSHNQLVLDLKQYILYIYLVDLIFQLIASGFFKSKSLFIQRLYDIGLIILYQMYLYGTIEIDITPFRIIRLLGSLGAIFPGLNRMLKGLVLAFMYMAESIIFTLLTSMLFASISVSLFHGFFNNRCNNTTEEWVQCVQGYCEEGVCIYYESSVDPTSTFNNIIYSFGQILRTVTMDGYTFTMYYMMRSFHNYVCVLFMIIIFIGGFFNFNLPIAVFKVYFSQLNEILDNDELMQKNKIHRFKLSLIREIGIINQIKSVLYYPYQNNQLNVDFTGLKTELDLNLVPRILGGLKEVEKKDFETKLNKIQDKLQTINLIKIALPKFRLLWNYYHKNGVDRKFKNILILNNLSNYLLLILEPPNIISLEVDFETDYKSGSQVAVLNDRMHSRGRQKIKFKKKLFYRTKEESNGIFDNQIKQQSSQNCFKLPVFKANRLQIIKQIDISRMAKSQQSSIYSHQIMNPKVMPMQYDSSNRSPPSIKDELQPFQNINEDEYPQLKLDEIIVSYNQLSTIINQNEKPLVPHKKELQFHVQYYKILEKEENRKVLNTKIWSGNNVLLQQTNTKSIFSSLNQKDLNIWLTELSGFYIISRKYAHKLINMPVGRFFFDICILINTLAVALQGIVSRDIIDQIEEIMLFVLLFELLVQLHIYSFKRFSRNVEFVIEFIVITVCLIEYIFEDQLNLSITSLRILKATKCLLFFRCIKYLQISRVIWVIFKITYQSTLHLIFLMFFTIFIFSLIGIQLYSHEFDTQYQEGYQSSFDDPLKGWMTIFNIMTNDDWYTIFSIGSNLHRVYAAFFSYSEVLVLNYFVFGVFMAISLDGFSQYLDQEENNLDNEFLANKLKSMRKFNKELQDRVEQYQTQEDSNQSSFTSNSSSDGDDNQNVPLQIQLAAQLQQQTIFKKHNVSNGVQTMAKLSQQQEFMVNLQAEQSNLRSSINIRKIKQQQSKFLQYLQDSIKVLYQELQKTSNQPYSSINCDSSFFIFDRSNIIRKYLHKLISNQVYTCIWLIIVVYQLILLTEIQEYGNYHSWLQILINFLLLIDKITKSIVYGVCFDEGSLINTTIWEAVDLIYIPFYFIYILDISEAPLVEQVQIFVYFRPILILYRLEWIKGTTVALSQSVYDMLNVLVFILLMWLIFAIFGIIIFSEKFGYCDHSYNYYVNYDDCLSENLTWYNYKHNFDNITVAMPALFVLATFDGLAEPLWVMQNSQFSYFGPEPYANQLFTYTFILFFCIIGGFILLNIFTGVLFINLKANSRALQEIQLTQSQQEYITVGNLIIKTIYDSSVHKNTQARKLTDSVLMQQFIYSVVILNAISILIFYREAPYSYLNTLNIVHHTCTVTLFLWCIIRLLSLGKLRFMESFWDRLYSIIIILGFVDLYLDVEYEWFDQFTQSDQTTQYYQLYRLMHMLRNIRLLAVFEGLPKVCRMVRVLSFSINYFFQIVFLFLIMLTVYAYFGVYLFSHIDKGLVINDLVHFKTFWMAFVALFKCASGDDFRSIMNDCMQHNPYCQTDSKYCGSPWAQLYFFSFMFVSNNILINLFILGLIERFELFFNNTDSILQTYVEQIENMRLIWEQLSGGNDFHMDVRYLPQFLAKISEPLGCKSYENAWDACMLAGAFKLKCDLQNQVSQNQVFYELFRKRYKTNVLKNGNEAVLEKMKVFDKQMRFRLFYYRVSPKEKRTNIGPQLQMKNKANVLNEMFAALLSFKTWQKYTEELISNVANNKVPFFSSRSLESVDQPLQPKHQISINDNESCKSEQPQYQRIQSKKQVTTKKQLEYHEHDQLKVFEYQFQPIRQKVASDFSENYSINSDMSIQKFTKWVPQLKSRQNSYD